MFGILCFSLSSFLSFSLFSYPSSRRLVSSFSRSSLLHTCIFPLLVLRCTPRNSCFYTRDLPFFVRLNFLLFVERVLISFLCFSIFPFLSPCCSDRKILVFLLVIHMDIYEHNWKVQPKRRLRSSSVHAVQQKHRVTLHILYIFAYFPYTYKHLRSR